MQLRRSHCGYGWEQTQSFWVERWTHGKQLLWWSLLPVDQRGIAPKSPHGAFPLPTEKKNIPNIWLIVCITFGSDRNKTWLKFGSDMGYTHKCLKTAVKLLLKISCLLLSKILCYIICSGYLKCYPAFFVSFSERIPNIICFRWNHHSTHRHCGVLRWCKVVPACLWICFCSVVLECNKRACGSSEQDILLDRFPAWLSRFFNKLLPDYLWKKIYNIRTHTNSPPPTPTPTQTSPSSS